MSEPVFVNEIDLEVKVEARTTSLAKPEWEVTNSAYALDGEDLVLAPGQISFPLNLVFTSVSKDWVFTGAGFRPLPDPSRQPPPCVPGPGPCGGCFSLPEAAAGTTLRIVDTPAKGDPAAYRFQICLQNVVTGERRSHDPRIYNHGKLAPPRTGCLSLLWRFRSSRW